MGKTSKTMKKPLPIAIILYALLGAILLGAFVLVNGFVTTVDNGAKEYFGFHAHVVRSNDMATTNFSVGDIVLSKKVDTNTLRVGDIITFYSDNPGTKGQMISHKIQQVVPGTGGAPRFLTYSTSTGALDAAVVESHRVIGKCQWSLADLGYFVVLMNYVSFEMHLFFLLLYVMGLLLLIYRFLSKRYAWKAVNGVALAEETASSEEQTETVADEGLPDEGGAEET